MIHPSMFLSSHHLLAMNCGRFSLRGTYADWPRFLWNGVQNGGCHSGEITGLLSPFTSAFQLDTSCRAIHGLQIYVRLKKFFWSSCSFPYDPRSTRLKPVGDGFRQYDAAPNPTEDWQGAWTRYPHYPGHRVHLHLHRQIHPKCLDSHHTELETETSY